MNINTLKINNKTRKILLDDRELVRLIEKEKQKFPFPPNFIPKVIEIRLDNILVVVLDIVKNQELNLKKNKIINKRPEIIDWRFDGECGLFIISETTIINRVEKLNIFSDELELKLI